jgi:hypothetical protein
MPDARILRGAEKRRKTRQILAGNFRRDDRNGTLVRNWRRSASRMRLYHVYFRVHRYGVDRIGNCEIRLWIGSSICHLRV